MRLCRRGHEHEPERRSDGRWLGCRECRHIAQGARYRAKMANSARREALRAQQREWYRLRQERAGRTLRVLLTEEEKLERARERQRERRRLEYAGRGPRPTVEQVHARVRMIPDKPSGVRVPTKIRDAYKRSSKGSIIQRKYPTWAAVRAGAERGDFAELARREY